MPFTAAHPAIILPFSRFRYMSATALIAGSVAPDFEYFFKLSVESYYSHTLPGLLYFDIPVAAFLSVIFHQLVKKNLINNLPPFLQRRFQHTLNLDFIQYLKQHAGVFAISILIGAISHLFWDSFTHNGGYFANRLSHYYSQIHIPFDGVRYPFFYALQQISTAVGLFVVVLFCIFQKPSAAPVSRVNLFYWVMFIFITAVTIVMRFTIHPSDYELGNLVVTTVSGMMLALVVNGFINFNNHGQTITMGASRQTSR